MSKFLRGFISFLLLGMLIAGVTLAGDRDYKLEGTFIEGFNCSSQSGAPPLGFRSGCQGMGIMSLTGGK